MQIPQAVFMFTNLKQFLCEHALEVYVTVYYVYMVVTRNFSRLIPDSWFMSSLSPLKISWVLFVSDLQEKEKEEWFFCTPIQNERKLILSFVYFILLQIAIINVIKR